MVVPPLPALLAIPACKQISVFVTLIACITTYTCIIVHMNMCVRVHMHVLVLIVIFVMQCVWKSNKMRCRAMVVHRHKYLLGTTRCVTTAWVCALEPIPLNAYLLLLSRDLWSSLGSGPFATDVNIVPVCGFQSVQQSASSYALHIV